MGPAVLNGGLSTFLAFFLLAFSDSYVFLTFFQVKKHYGFKMEKEKNDWGSPGRGKANYGTSSQAQLLLLVAVVSYSSFNIFFL